MCSVMLVKKLFNIYFMKAFTLKNSGLYDQHAIWGEDNLAEKSCCTSLWEIIWKEVS